MPATPSELLYWHPWQLTRLITVHVHPAIILHSHRSNEQVPFSTPNHIAKFLSWRTDSRWNCHFRLLPTVDLIGSVMGGDGILLTVHRPGLLPEPTPIYKPATYSRVPQSLTTPYIWVSRDALTIFDLPLFTLHPSRMQVQKVALRRSSHLSRTTAARRNFSSSAPRSKPRLVVLGSGWGGYEVLRGINKKQWGKPQWSRPRSG